MAPSPTSTPSSSSSSFYSFHFIMTFFIKIVAFIAVLVTCIVKTVHWPDIPFCCSPFLFMEIKLIYACSVGMKCLLFILCERNESQRKR